MNNHPTNSIILEGCHQSVLKIGAIKQVRQASDCGLAEAKKALEDCLLGRKPRIDLASGLDAMMIAERLADLGIVVRIGDRIVDRYEAADMASKYHDDQIGSVKIMEILQCQNDHSFIVVGELLGGSVVTGNQLGIPLNSTLVVTSDILTVDTSDKLIKLELASNDDSFQFWESMNVIDEELPVLERKD